MVSFKRNCSAIPMLRSIGPWKISLSRLVRRGDGRKCGGECGTSARAVSWRWKDISSSFPPPDVAKAEVKEMRKCPESPKLSRSEVRNCMVRVEGSGCGCHAQKKMVVQELWVWGENYLWLIMVPYCTVVLLVWYSEVALHRILTSWRESAKIICYVSYHTIPTTSSYSGTTLLKKQQIFLQHQKYFLEEWSTSYLCQIM